eukprot:9293267-Alexandrium_andersonii.AAC.1
MPVTDLGVAASSGRPEGPPTKQRAVSSEQESVKKLLTLVAKLGLSSAQSVRALTGAVFRTWLLPSESACVVSAKDAGEKYADFKKSDNPDERKHVEGITPNHFVMNQLLTTFVIH